MELFVISNTKDPILPRELQRAIDLYQTHIIIIICYRNTWGTQQLMIGVVDTCAPPSHYFQPAKDNNSLTREEKIVVLGDLQEIVAVFIDFDLGKTCDVLQIVEVVGQSLAHLH